MADWTALPTDILVMIAKSVYFFEDFLSFYAVCKSWYAVTSVLGKSRPLPSRFPWVMLTDKAEVNFPKVAEGENPYEVLMDEVWKDEQIEGMHNRPFYSFLTSKAYDFELPEATRKKCIGVGYGLLLTLGFEQQISILNPFTRQQIGMPNMLSFKTNINYSEMIPPQRVVSYFVEKVAISSNPFIPSNEDCIVMAIYGDEEVLGFARPGDKVWTDVCLPRPVVGTYPMYQDVIFYNGKFHAVDMRGNIVVCDINDAANEPKATIIASGGPDEPSGYIFRYLVESSGDLLLVVRFRNDLESCDTDRQNNYTEGFSIFKMEECDGDNYRYKFTEVNNLGNIALFIGNNASVSVPASRCVKANSIYFGDEDVGMNWGQPYGSGLDTGIYDVGSGNITPHYASKFMSLLTPPTWIIS